MSGCERAYAGLLLLTVGCAHPAAPLLPPGQLLSEVTFSAPSALASGGVVAAFPLGGTLVGLDSGASVDPARRQLFRADTGLVATGPSGAAAFGSAGGDLFALLVPGAGLGLLDSAGAAQAGWPLTSDLPLAGGATVAGGLIYFVDSGGGRLVALGADGALRWSFSAPAGEKLAGRPVLDAAGLVYATTDRSLYAIAAPASGTAAAALWVFTPDAAVVPTAAVGTTAVYVGGADGQLYAVQR